MHRNPTPAASVGTVETQTVAIDLPAEGFVLEGGGSLPGLSVAYETYGRLNARRDNVIFICHALSGDAHVAGRHAASGEDGNAADAENPDDTGWWDEMVGPGKGIDTDYYQVICANILGGCRGTTGPSSTNPATGAPYGSTFPAITVGDIVNVHRLLLRQLGIDRIAAVVGGSFGGMQALEWIIRYPDMIDRCLCIASATSLATQALAFDVVGRNAITSDPDWQHGDYYATGRTPARGLAQARKIGHITYLSSGMMTRKFGRERREGHAPQAEDFRSTFQVESYLDHQGEKFLRRFDANSYLHISRAMDEYDLSERFGDLDAAFAAIRAKVLVVALSEDWLFPPQQSMEIASALLRGHKRVCYCRLHAPHGHDGFLVDIEHLSEVIRAFLPWVGGNAAQKTAVDRATAGDTPDSPARASSAPVTEEFARIAEMIEPGARVVDLGCADGELLTILEQRRGTTGIGVDIDLGHVVNVIDRGHDVFQGDIDVGLSMIADNAYDYAVLGGTLQVVRRPRFALREMLRVAGQGIVSFPNFGKWTHRLYLLGSGRMPKSRSLPYEWYDTPNIHLFTLRDFARLCNEDGIDILRTIYLTRGVLGRLMVWAGMRNAGADRVIAKIARR